MRCARGMKLMVLVVLAAAGCKRGETPAAERTHAASAVDAGEAAVPALRRPQPRPAAADGGIAVKPPSLPPAPGVGTQSDAGTPLAPRDTTAAAARSPADAGAAAVEPDAVAQEWTAGVVKREGPVAPPSAQLSAVRAARQEGFDRVVIEFAGGALPGYHVEYVDKPLIRCGSGEPTQVAGRGWLQVRLAGAQAHTEEGKPTVAPRERTLQLGVLRELEQTCDFEGEVTWVLGLQKPNRFRVLELKAPTRLVVDVRH